MYLVLNLFAWCKDPELWDEFLESSDNPIAAQGFGFAPVLESEEEAKRLFPESKILECRNFRPPLP